MSLHWAEQIVPSGIAALLVATEPLWIAILMSGEQASRWSPRVIGATGLILSAVLLLKASTAQRRTQSGEGLCPPQDARADRVGA